MQISINLCINSQLPLALDFFYSESSLKLPAGLFARRHLETFETSVSLVAISNSFVNLDACPCQVYTAKPQP